MKRLREYGSVEPQLGRQRGTRALPSPGVLQLLLILLQLVGAVSARAQQQEFRRFGEAAGLNNLDVRCLVQDNTGFIWAGTDNGIFRFDGARFRSYGHAEGLPSTEIVALGFSPRANQVWAATPEGVVSFDGRKFERRALPPNIEAASVRQIVFDASGAMYLATTSSLYRGVPGDQGSVGFRELLKAGIHGMSGVHGLLIEDGEQFVGRGSGLWRLRDGTAEEIGEHAGLPSDEWAAIVRDSSGDLWVRSTTRLYELPVGQDRFVDRSRGVLHALEPHLSADRQGHVFVATSGSAVIVNGESMSTLGAKEGLPDEGVTTMLIDRNDTLWLGAEGAGLVHRLGHGEWASWKRENGLLSNSVWAVQQQADKKLWVGTSAGLTLLGANGKTIASWTTENGLPSDRVLSLEQAPSGDLFAGTDPNGLTQFSSSGTLIRSYLADEAAPVRVSAIATDRKGRLWVVGDHVFRSDPALQAGAKLHLERMPVPGEAQPTMYRDVSVSPNDEAVWIATSRGLLRFSMGRWRLFTTADGLVSNNLGAVVEHKGAVWVAYRDALGLTRFEVTGDHLSGRPLTTKNGLASDAAYSIAFDHEDHLWISSDKGLDVVADGRVKHYSSADGLVWDDTNGRALSVDHDGDVWIGTSGGLSRFSSLRNRSQGAAARPVLSAVHTGGHEWDPGDSPVLPYSNRSIAFEYAALGSSLDKPTFHYRLQGGQDTWVSTSEPSVQFAALSPGRYVFEVYIEGQSAPPARFSFSVQSPWWLRWYFILTWVSGVGLLTRLVWRLRVRALVSQQQRLQEIVTLQTAELRIRQEELETMAYADYLTALPNRRMFNQVMKLRLEAAMRDTTAFTMLLVDLDRFKDVNDTYGHDAGDAVLACTASRLRAATRTTDFVARLGGDEFAVILDATLTADEVEGVCHRIVKTCAEPIPFKSRTLLVGCSVGIATYPKCGSSADDLSKAADVALYEVKRSGRNGYSWFPAPA